MIKKLPYLIVYFFISCITYAQQVEANPNDCIQNFTINSKTLPGDNQHIDDIVISWDFSDTLNAQNIELNFEIQPLNACWKGLEAPNRSGLESFKIPNVLENAIGNRKLEYNTLNCKCIKWRVLIIDTSTNCEIKSNWQYSSFL
nr:hypothetical protein [uncultured Psychroserpens sp.]